MLQNTRTQTHESPPIQQNQPKSNTKSIQGTQKHKLKNTKKQNIFKSKDLFKPVTVMTTGVNGSTQQRLNPNQSVPALIPLDRPQTE